MNAAEALEEMLAEHDAEEVERDALIAEATQWVFEEGPPTLTLDLTLSAMWQQWDAYTGRVDAWAAGYDRMIVAVQRQLQALPRGKASAEDRRRLKDALEDAAWRRGCARHLLYNEYPVVQNALRDLIGEAWRESGVSEDLIDARLDEWGCTIAERRALYQIADWTLGAIAAQIALD